MTELLFRCQQRVVHDLTDHPVERERKEEAKRRGIKFQFSRVSQTCSDVRRNFEETSECRYRVPHCHYYSEIFCRVVSWSYRVVQQKWPLVENCCIQFQCRQATWPADAQPISQTLKVPAQFSDFGVIFFAHPVHFQRGDKCESGP